MLCTEWDWKLALEVSRAKALEEGAQKGREEAFKEGILKGREQGREEGIALEQNRILTLLNQGYTTLSGNLPWGEGIPALIGMIFSAIVHRGGSSMTDSEQAYTQQLRLYERQRKIYEDDMRLWETCNETTAQMDAKFDKALFTIAAGSFGVSFAFMDKVVPISTSQYTPILVASWGLFAACLIMIILGHLLSAESYRKLRDQIARNMILKYEGRTPDPQNTQDGVSPCNYVSFILFISGVICLLLFVLLNV